MTPEQADRELDEHLAGQSAVSRLYRQAATEMPSATLDARIQQAARRHISTGKPRWMLPLSAAAAVLLAFGVLLEMQQQGITPVPVEPMDEASSTAAPAIAPEVPQAQDAPKEYRNDSAPAAETLQRETRADPRESKKAEPFPASPPAQPPASPSANPAVSRPDAAQQKAQTPRQDGTTGAMPQQAPAPSTPAADATMGEESAAIRAPEDWLARIRELRAQGRSEDAARELRIFREHYPDYPLPQDLRDQP